MWLARTTDWFKLLHLPDIGWLPFLAAAGCLVVLIWAIVRLIANVNEDVDPAEADREMLQAINDLRREGDLTEVEFRSIKGQLVARLSTAFQVSPKKGRGAKSADEAEPELNDKDLAEDFSAKLSATNESDVASSQPNKPESFASPTNVPESSQDTSHLPPGTTAQESENNEGMTDSDPDRNSKY